jgi:hypothetical protein
MPPRASVPNATEGEVAVAGNLRTRELGEKRSRYVGNDITFRLLGGRFRVIVSGIGVDLSFVGRGTITLASAGKPGTVSLDGGDTYRPLPPGATTFSFPPGP